MPYCEPCDKYRAPNALLVDGTCPKCGNEVAEGGFMKTSDDDGDLSAEANTGINIPWHFWVMVGATAIYLGWRVIQGLMALL